MKPLRAHRNSLAARPRMGRGTAITRRNILAGALGAGALGALSACAGGQNSQISGLTFGSNRSDAVPKAAYQKVIDTFTQRTGISVSVNTIDHNTFQEQISSYLQGQPDDVFTWFAGYRVRYFADLGLVSDLDDVWENISQMFSPSMREVSTATDGRPYFVPYSYYPWVVNYRKSVFEKHGWQPPKTLDELKELAQDMQKTGLTPIAFADRGGWEAFGMFDILNMRINGFEFHQELMAGCQNWASGQAREVFKVWADLLPLHQEGALGRSWQEAAQTLQQGKTGMYLLGTFISQQFQDEDDPTQIEDLGFFTFPEINPDHGTDSLDAPVDGFMLSSKAENPESARRLLEFLASPEAQKINVDAIKGQIAANDKTDVSGYTQLQRDAKEIVDKSDHISQFMDRDTRPDFAATVMIPSIQSFIRDPKNIDDILNSIEAQKKSIFVDE